VDKRSVGVGPKKGEAAMKNAKQERAPDFARVLGRMPCVEGGEALIHIDLDEIVGAFGPPEIQVLKTSRRLFWNFQTRDDVGRFSLWVEIPVSRKSTENLDIEVSTNRRRDWTSFLDWVFDRLGAVSSCEEPPVAINGANFVVVPA
jgi:hypothetical protein